MTTLTDRKETRVSHDQWQAAANYFEQVIARACQRLVGRDRELKAVIVTSLAGGHVLLEGVPGVAKTQLLKDLAAVLGLDFKRIQFTPDRLPSELTGFNLPDGTFVPGPLFANFVLGDEINRASPKTQAAMLEAMGEGQITVDGKTRLLLKPFLVAATQNPIEHEGTYPLPEAQLDRFLMWVKVGRVTDPGLLRQIARLNLNGRPDIDPYEPGGMERHLPLRWEVAVEDGQIDAMSAMLERINDHPDVQYGPGERALIALVRAAQACALLDGDSGISTRHTTEFAPDILRHRIQLRDSRHLDEPERVEEIIADALRA